MVKENILVEGELFSNFPDEEIQQNILTDLEINEKYKKGEIRIVTEQARYPLDNISPMLDSGKYDRNPEYQRRKRWDTVRKSRLIESFIMNVPIPPIFLYEVDYSAYEVMDGLQRLTAIDDFYKNKYALNGLQYWQELNGRTYQNLPEQVRKGIDRRYLSSIVLLQETAKSPEEAEFLKQIVFERLNSGGEKLTPQETRNALYNGKFNKLCIRLAKNDIFRKMWRMPLESDGEEALLNNEEYRKMQDVELVLRFFAYRHINKFGGMTVEKFLDEFLKQANLYPESTMIELEKIFVDTIDLIYKIFNNTAFLLPSVKAVEYRTPSKTIYDPIMQSFAQHLSARKMLENHANSIRENLYDQKRFYDISNGKYMFDGRYNNRNDVKTRIKFYNEFLDMYAH